MFPYVSSPEAPEVEAAMRHFDIAWLRPFLERRLGEGSDDPELGHVLGLLLQFSGEPESMARANEHLERAYDALRRRGDTRKASLVAVSLGRLHHDGIGDHPVGTAGWRGR